MGLAEWLDDQPVNLLRDLLGSDGLQNPRSLSREQLLVLRVLTDVLHDLRKNPHQDHRPCVRSELALSWIDGRLRCGCDYDGPLSLVDVAEILRQEPEQFRARVLAAVRAPTVNGNGQQNGDPVRSRFVYGR